MRPGEARAFEPRKHQRSFAEVGLALGVPFRFYTFIYSIGREVSVCSPSLKRPCVAPPLHLKMWVENEGEHRREPLAVFRPQTLPVWECVGAEWAPEQNN